MIKIISFKICPFVQRVTALLEAKNIDYDLEYISLKDKPQWFMDISPTGQVPILITESGQALFESDAIVEYLDEVFLPLEQNITPEQRASDRAWSYQATKHYLIQCSTQRSPDKLTLVERAKKLDKAFEKVEQALGQGPYFKGKQISNIDIAWLPLLHRAAIIRRYTCYDFLAQYPKMKKWQESILKTDIPKKSVPEDFEEAFTNFYLADDTFLGSEKSCDNKRDGICNEDGVCEENMCC